MSADPPFRGHIYARTPVVPQRGDEWLVLATPLASDCELAAVQERCFGTTSRSSGAFRRTVVPHIDRLLRRWDCCACPALEDRLDRFTDSEFRPSVWATTFPSEATGLVSCRPLSGPGTPIATRRI